jgi:hypothetical protein
LLSSLAVVSLLSSQQRETPTTRLLGNNEAEQVAYLNNFIAEGAPGDNDSVEALVLSKTSLFVPMIEYKIEEILALRSRERLFRSPSVDPPRVVSILAMMIEYTGEAIALEQASKLMRIDEDRFGSMVEHCLGHAYGRGRGFRVAYRGLEIGDPAVDKRIMAWANEGIGIMVEPNRAIVLRKWAKEVVEEYNGAPDEYQWAKDPIVSRLSADRLNPPGRAPLHDEMFRLIAEVAQKRPKK